MWEQPLNTSAASNCSYDKKHMARYKQTMNLVFPYIGSLKPLRILDFGTGTGHVAISIKNSFPQHEIIAGDVTMWDNSLEKLNDAGIKAIDGLKFEPGKSLSVPDNYFDAVFFLEVLEHIIDDPRHIFAELNRILRKDGYLFLTTPNIAQLFNRIMLLFGKQPQLYLTALTESKGARGHFREWTAAELSLLLEGFFRTRQFKFLDTMNTEGLVRRKKWLRIAYYPYKFLCYIKPSYRDTIVFICQKQ
jgi:ubiquinone/menaquinone biosynthesis C-methylase UbiE